MKVVGKRLPPATPAESLKLAESLITEAEKLIGAVRRPPFVLKARTWEEYEAWKRRQANPRYW